MVAIKSMKDITYQRLTIAFRLILVVNLDDRLS